MNEMRKTEKFQILCGKHSTPVQWIGTRSECAKCVVERELKLSQYFLRGGKK